MVPVANIRLLVGVQNQHVPVVNSKKHLLAVQPDMRAGHKTQQNVNLVNITMAPTTSHVQKTVIAQERGL